MSQTRKDKRERRSANNRSISTATWVFGSLLFVFFIGVFIFAPSALPEFKQRMLAIACALLSGLFAFFLTGDVVLRIKPNIPCFGNLGIKATGGFAIFVFVLVWWGSPHAPVKDTDRLVKRLEEELPVREFEIEFDEGQIVGLKVKEPSLRARELAGQIPDDADPYALALKAMAERRYAEAEPLFKRALAIKEKALGPEHPDVATSLSNLAFFYYQLGKYAEAVPLVKRALAIKEKALGPEHPDVATSLNNLALLYKSQGKYAEAEPLYKRGLAIYEKALGPEHPHVATCLENYAVLMRHTHRQAQADSLEARAKAIRSKLAEQKATKEDSIKNKITG